MKINQRDYDYINFDIIKENWCSYELEDKTIIKVKIILAKIISIDHNKEISCNTTVVVSAFTTKEGKGNPSLPNVMPEIDKKDLPFKILEEEWNEYKMEDGRILKIKPSIIEISKGTTYDQYGEPSYLVQSQTLIKI